MGPDSNHMTYIMKALLTLTIYFLMSTISIRSADSGQLGCDTIGNIYGDFSAQHSTDVYRNDLNNQLAPKPDAGTKDNITEHLHCNNYHNATEDDGLQSDIASNLPTMRYQFFAVFGIDEQYIKSMLKHMLDFGSSLLDVADIQKLFNIESPSMDNGLIARNDDQPASHSYEYGTSSSWSSSASTPRPLHPDFICDRLEYYDHPICVMYRTFIDAKNLWWYLAIALSVYVLVIRRRS